MSTFIFFVESYTAGGADRVANLLVRGLNADKIILFVNKSADKKILFQGVYSEHVEIVEYSLVSPMDIGLFANRYKRNKLIYRLIKGLDYIVRYPLLLFSIIYFYVKFKNTNATHFFAHNGGYPGGFFCGTAALAASIYENIKLYYGFHSMPQPYSFPQKIIERPWDKYLDQHCTMISVSEMCSKALLELRSFVNPPVSIHNGLAEVERKTYIKNSHLKLLHVGYFDANKNQKMILRCLSSLLAKGINQVSVTFVGGEDDPSVYQEFLDLMRKLGLDEYVNLEGFQTDVSHYYYEHDVLLLSSNIEGFPLVVLEAMRVGMPVISTDVGGVSEQIVDGCNGFLIKANNILAMTDKIEYFYNNKNEVEVMGTNAFDIFNEKFSLEKMIHKYNNTLQL